MDQDKDFFIYSDVCKQRSRERRQIIFLVVTAIWTILSFSMQLIFLSMAINYVREDVCVFSTVFGEGREQVYCIHIV